MLYKYECVYAGMLVYMLGVYIRECLSTYMYMCVNPCVCVYATDDV